MLVPLHSIAADRVHTDIHHGYLQETSSVTVIQNIFQKNDTSGKETCHEQ